MKWCRSVPSICVLVAVSLYLSIGKVNAREPKFASDTLAAAHSAKQQCVNTCRARYRDCLRLKQMPSFECQGVYQDCTRYSCTGLGPG